MDLDIALTISKTTILYPPIFIKVSLKVKYYKDKKIEIIIISMNLCKYITTVAILAQDISNLFYLLNNISSKFLHNL